MSAFDELRLIFARDPEPQCRRFSEYMAIHWYETGATNGSRCLCGEATREDTTDVDCEPEPEDAA